MTGQEICRDLDALRGQGAPLETLLRRAVELLHQSNPRFHWTGIYELYPDNVLRLGPFIGAPTDHVFIAVGQGVCGTAVAERRNINVPDVRKAENYLACSTATQRACASCRLISPGSSRCSWTNQWVPEMRVRRSWAPSTPRRRSLRARS